ncbi:hypothetical protein IGI04_040636 [Brassica rapa subsp. trilocularis]|uniref:Uncharacterized protein n=1 Tax=Brassica rapa subsp. trilocularis TaxID=1813537 RepID=A0ABQ7KRD0_BRACM|nr:hypothetical protein IGI04_040636 [Brassica rapa subsp. trilocularis]
MTTGGTNPDTSGEEPALTPPPPPPLLSSEFMSSVIARLAHQEEVQKTTNDQLAAIVAALSASTGNSQPLRPTVAQVDSAAGSSRTPPGLTKSCKLHGVKGHDTSECKTLFAQFLSSLESGEIKIPPPKPKSENSWSRNKDRKNQRKNQAKPRQDDQKPKVAEQIPHQDDDGDASADEDPPAARQRIEVIHAQPESSSDEESDLEEALDPLDLRVLLKRKTTSTNDKTPGSSDLRVELNAKRTKHSLSP